MPEEFTQENGLSTPTMKRKRRTIREQYTDEIADMYDEKAFEQVAVGED